MPGTLKARAKKEKGKKKKSRSLKGGLALPGKRETVLAGDTRSRTAEFESVEQALRRERGSI